MYKSDLRKSRGSTIYLLHTPLLGYSTLNSRPYCARARPCKLFSGRRSLLWYRRRQYKAVFRRRENGRYRTLRQASDGHMPALLSASNSVRLLPTKSTRDDGQFSPEFDLARTRAEGIKPRVIGEGESRERTYSHIDLLVV